MEENKVKENKITPDFDNDNAIGKIGERRFKEILSKSPKTKKFKDVSDDKRNQKQDIDVWQVTVDDKLVHYEVKTDRQGLKTRNVVYELTSHDHAGCLARSNAEFVFYAFVDPKNVEDIKEQYLIHLEKWRQWQGKYHWYINRNKKKYGLLVYSTQPDTDGIPMNALQMLCNIDTMVQDGVAIQIDDNGRLIKGKYNDWKTYAELEQEAKKAKKTKQEAEKNKEDGNR